MDAFGDRFYAVARALGFTNNTALGKHLGVARGEVQRLNEKLFAPTAEKVQHLAGRLGIPWEALTVQVRTAATPRPSALPAEVRALLVPAAKSDLSQNHLHEVENSLTMPPTPSTDTFSVRESEAALLRRIGARAYGTLWQFIDAVENDPARSARLCDVIEDAIKAHRVGKSRRHSGGGR